MRATNEELNVERDGNQLSRDYREFLFLFFAFTFVALVTFEFALGFMSAVASI